MIFSVIFLTQFNASAQSPGIFDNNSDVGLVTHTGSARFIQSSSEYEITGSGANMWGQKDAFQYLWKKDSGGKPVQLNTDFADRCNNDHGFSPDGKLLAISHHHEGKSLIYVLSATGGTPRLVTELGPSYWHGWSPDGKTLAYCAERNGNYDIYTIPVNGGRETRLTNTEGLDDGPDYSPDGRYIYFNSERTGVMKIWRMNTDGTNQIQMTKNDQFADWFAHPSGDGKQIVFLSYDKDVKGHPPNKNVTLRIMPSSGDKPRILTRLFGGQGTINVPSWSPDNKYIAFVSYRLVGKYKGPVNYPGQTRTTREASGLSDEPAGPMRK